MSAVVVMALFGWSCGGETESVPQSRQELSCPPVSGTDVTRSLAVRDPAALALFSFERTMSQIIDTSQVVFTETPRGVFQRWMSTFSAGPGAPGVDPEGYGLVSPRNNEGQLANVNPFAARSKTTFEPLALFNRFDLAPTTGSNCGEYRIVYGMKTTQLTGRALVIFEASLPNPHPEQGLAGCLDIALFWRALTDEPDAAVRASKLEAFYFLGTAIPGVVPVVRASNYGLAAAGRREGQVRTNFFLGGPGPQQWNLREFKLLRNCNTGPCQLQFQHVTVKTNPANELFAGTHSRSQEFQSQFVQRMDSLATPSDVNLLGMNVDDVHNEFESISQTPSPALDYVGAATPAFKSLIQTKLTQLQSRLTPDQVLTRAQTQTCGGCHQLSNVADLGAGLVWPASGGFVHVNESPNLPNQGLSPALADQFLPRRKTVLEQFITAQCTGQVAPVQEGFTIGGSIEGAAN